VAKKQTNGNLALEQQRVIVIPAHDEIVARKLRVAAYARVSSSSEDQLNSYRVQNQYYSELISNNPDWEMVDIYADEGITGTSVEKREDFQRMMRDCRKGKIDRILVKSISRFARNTKDCLAAIRELKELGISVLFEEQGIDTSKVSSEMVTAIMASLAQKGSESISGNVRWGIQKRMEDGIYVASSAPYGYRLVNLQLEIQPEEAEIVRWIFQQYLAGANVNEIAKELNARSAENSHKWYKAGITYILSNERYIGDCLWQKCYMTKTIPAKQVINKGERTQYYAEGKHPAIIDKATFYAAQRLREQKKATNGSAADVTYSILTGRILCGECGTTFRRRNWRGISRWSCRTHSENINLQSFLIQLTMIALNIVIFVIVYGRMIEIYLLTSLAPIPFATVPNRETGHMGQNYFRSLFAVGFQGLLILVCVAIYAVLIQSIATDGDPIGAIWGCVGYTVLLCFTLFKTGSLAKSIFGCH